MKEWASQSDRDRPAFEIIPRPFCSVAESRNDAVKEAERELRFYLSHLMGNSRMLKYAGISYREILDLHKVKLSSTKSKRMVENFSASGTPQEISNQIEGMLKAGATHICFGHPLGKDPVEALKLLGEKVCPSFRNSREPDQSEEG